MFLALLPRFSVASYALLFLHCALMIFFLSGCSEDGMNKSRHKRTDPLDRAIGKSYDDVMKDVFSAAEEKKRAEEAQKKSGVEPPIPDISPILAAPKSPEASSEKLVSLSLTEEVPLKDVLIELGRIADIDLEIDTGIKGGIILRVRDKPLSDVLNRIAIQSGLRVRQERGITRVERDLPYVKNYPVDFLNLIRSNSGNLSISTQVLSSSGGGGGGGVTTGASSAISSSYDGDMWKSVEADIKNILKHDPALSFAEKPDDTKVIATSAAAENKDGANSLMVNKQAGVITILANESQHKNIAKYLERVRISSSAQVLIEAKVVDVTLNDEYKTGINWTGLNMNPDLRIAGSFASGATANQVKFTVFASDGPSTSIESAVDLTEKFGVSRTLSSPRLTALNNQQAVMTFAQNEVYFTLKLQEQSTQSTGGGDEKLSIQSEFKTVPVGVMLSLQPSINLETSEITMNVRPTISVVSSRVDDPGVSIIAQRSKLDNIVSQVPVIEVKELDSVLKMKSGQVMVIGGLMKNSSDSTDTGVPFISRAPLVGNLFKSVSKTNTVVETVIFIKATIINGSSTDATDRKVYKELIQDSHPIAF